METANVTVLEIVDRGIWYHYGYAQMYVQLDVTVNNISWLSIYYWLSLVAGSICSILHF